MKEEFERRIIEKYRNMFPDDAIMSNPNESCLAFGFECGKGWTQLLENLFEELSHCKLPEDFKISQIKSKFAGLRFYVECGTDEIYEVIRKYEDMSYNVCEICGTSPASQIGRGWITTLCESCVNAKKADIH